MSLQHKSDNSKYEVYFLLAQFVLLCEADSQLHSQKYAFSFLTFIS